MYVIGGRRLDKNFLAALNLSADMRTLLYQNRGEHFIPELLIDPGNSAATGGPRPADKLAPLIEAVRQSNQEMTSVVHWSADQADDELFHAIPLRGSGKDRPLLGILLVGHSLRSYVELKRRIRFRTPCGQWRNRAGPLAQQLGRGASHPSCGRTGPGSTRSRRRKLEYAGGGCRQR